MSTVASCKKEASLEDKTLEPRAARLEVPGNFPVVKEEIDNPLTLEGIELGRKLFYDVRLSGSNRISCASCHRQDLAFTDGIPLSNIGESGKRLDRHAPALFNLAWAEGGLFWDGGSKNLESQAFGPLTSEDEMHQDLYVLENELKQVPEYLRQFKLVFGEDVKSANVVRVLAQFQRTLISGNSKYDKYRRGESGIMLSDIELLGMNLVAAKCKGCHTGELFTDNGYHNNGIDDTFSEEHEGVFQGRFRVSFDPLDIGKFKTPSLRNVMLTAPYMHDGRLKTIDEVLDHYQSGIQLSPSTDILLFQNRGQVGIPMNANEKAAIKAFLASLTDNDFINNKKISNPNL
ncbi:cytochrome C peroxidase [Pedobacter sp. BAL39]|nr:cytochrome C peroxidase [Pedobacter sp. BAL39]